MAIDKSMRTSDGGAMNNPTLLVTVAPPNATDYTQTQPCGCSLDGRCEVHTAMMRVVRSAYESQDVADFHAVGRLADGFGSPGAHYGDWSAWRDASIPSLEAMWRAATQRGLR